MDEAVFLGPGMVVLGGGKQCHLMGHIKSAHKIVFLATHRFDAFPQQLRGRRDAAVAQQGGQHLLFRCR
ncbi:hypothetical protein [Serratia sp. P2ACOL2]|uniref:hypothetical protein n=1 Tax=Serratia sp. P2ACOL2 TaxID=2482769 RepID=UPI001EE3CBBA|nr:hypothetical protein [Serratia sp. P2ACOL2]